MEDQPNEQTSKSLSLAGISFGRKESPKEFESLPGYILQHMNLNGFTLTGSNFFNYLFPQS
jgi:hypothetical protein